MHFLCVLAMQVGLNPKIIIVCTPLLG